MTPNWCSSDLLVEGDQETISAFKDIAKSDDGKEPLDMNKFIPYPRRFLRMDRGVYKWRDACKDIYDKVSDNKNYMDDIIEESKIYLHEKYHEYLLIYYSEDEIKDVSGSVYEKWIKNEGKIYIDRYCNLMNCMWGYKKKFKSIRELWDRYSRLTRINDGYNSGGYDWCYDNWGTKWNFSDVEIIRDDYDDLVSYTFDTAWSPPTKVIIKMSERFPMLKFTLNYYECGLGFMGIEVFKDGIMLEEFYTEEYIGDRGG